MTTIDADDRAPMGEVWWIHSKKYGLRIAHFGSARGSDGAVEIFFILGDTINRTGVRIWDDVSKREGWRKIERIPVPKVDP